MLDGEAERAVVKFPHIRTITGRLLDYAYTWHTNTEDTPPRRDNLLSHAGNAPIATLDQ